MSRERHVGLLCPDAMKPVPLPRQVLEYDHDREWAGLYEFRAYLPGKGYSYELRKKER